MKQLLLATAIATLVTACATATSPTGRTQRVGAVSQAELNRLGAEAFAQAKASNRQGGDARQNAYVRCVVDAVTRQLPSEWQAQWDVALFADESPNAFALPGGKVGINTGIFKVARNQDQLAAVIAHEIGHVVSRHHDERITRQLGTQTLLGIGSAILGSQYGEGAAQAANQLGGAAAQGLFLLPNNRAQESEADILGQQLMARAGFDPRQAVNLWENMIDVGGARGPAFLSTHPDPRERLDELRNRATELTPVHQQARASGRAPNCG
ncbi:M48 family metallopeptidase [Lysobacter korlensis]|uniref:M48 family metallopeptidase n=1 Tax=Lysobacter korlensis TaxID=553636 RepID=A0ABV6RIQ9_9GAMM